MRFFQLGCMILLGIGIVGANQAIADDSVIVNTQQGPIRGYLDQGAYSFKGIPYAVPPVGELRWQPPRAPQPFGEVFDARDFGNVCVQTTPFDPHGEVIGDENCLSLNVWAPVEKQNGPLPVMVFIHGGAQYWGASAFMVHGTNIYDGEYLAEHGPAIVVTLNYRLGPFGFLAHRSFSQGNENPVSGNYGILDQIAALQWVQRNIDAFGGDPSRVMIFGESAGGYNVLALFTSPFAKGLFSRALVQSGGPTLGTLSMAEETGNRLAGKLGCIDDSSAAACLRAKSPSEIIRALPENTTSETGAVTYVPVVDGLIIPESTPRALRAGRFNHVPIIIGTNAKEMTTLLPLFVPDPIESEYDYESYVYKKMGPLAPSALSIYPSYRYSSPREALVEMLSDSFFHCPTRQMLREIADHQDTPVLRYVYSHAYHSLPLSMEGAGHATELTFVFHNFYSEPGYEPDASEVAMSDVITKYWVQFAATGDPNLPGLANWPKYDPQADDYLNIDTHFSEGNHFHMLPCDYWDPITALMPGYE